MVEYDGSKEKSVPLGGQKNMRRPMTEAYYKNEDKKMSKPKQPDSGARVEKKPDAMRHDGKNVFGKEKANCLPGQQYVPKSVHNESKFAGEQKQKEMY